MSVPDSAVKRFLAAALQLGADDAWVSQVEIGRQIFPDDEALGPSVKNTAAECENRGLATTTVEGSFMLTPEGVKAAKG